MSSKKIGLIGVGVFALMAHWQNIKDDPRVQIVAICCRNPDLLEKAAATIGNCETYFDWRVMLEKESLDGVIICTPNHLHAEIAIAALQRDLHVLVEKPMATTVADAAAMIDVAQKSDGELMVGYNNRCNKSWVKTREIVQSGVIGQILQISIVSHTNLRFIYDPDIAPDAVHAWIENAGEYRPFIEDRSKAGNWRGVPELSGGGWHR